MVDALLIGGSRVRWRPGLFIRPPIALYVAICQVLLTIFLAMPTPFHISASSERMWRSRFVLGHNAIPLNLEKQMLQHRPQRQHGKVAQCRHNDQECC